MNDEQIFEALRTALDTPVEPDAAFADRLYASLAVDLGYGNAEGSIGRGFVERLSRTLGLGRGVAGSAAMRFARLASLAALLVALALSAALIGGRLLEVPVLVLTGDEIVQQSQALYPNPPAFDMTVGYPGSNVVRYRYDGGEQLRTDVLAGYAFDNAAAPGSFRIETATQTATYDADRKSWYLADLPAPRPPLFSMFPLNWIAPTPFRPPEPPPGYRCPNGWQRQADGLIAARPAYHVTCGAEADFWIDQSSRLVVGSALNGLGEAAPTGSTGPVIGSPAIGATSLAVDPDLNPGIFALVMPAGAHDAINPPPSTVLVVGQVAPDWQGPLDGGGTFDSATLRGEPAVVLVWADWCEPCIEALGAFAVVARDSQGVGFVSVSWVPTSEAALRAAVDATGGGYPVVRDDSGAIVNDWGLSGVPMLVLLRTDGTVASLTFGPVGSAADLKEMVVALTNGEPIPSPGQSPATSECACPNESPTPRP